MLSVKGTFHNGVARPEEPIKGRDGQSVIITFLDETPQNGSQTEGWDALTRLIEDCAMDTEILDLARQHDHYLYGKSKQG